MNPLKMIKEFLENLKNILLDYLRSRIFPVTVLMFFLFFLLGRRLFVLQIKNGDEYQVDFTVRTEKTLTIDSVRGNIYDVKGRLLAYNKLTYDLTFGNNNYITKRAEGLGISENILKNQVVYDVMQILKIYNDKITVDFPIEYKNGEYKYTASGISLKNFLRDAYSKNTINELSDEELATPAEDIIYHMRFGGSDLPNFEISEDYSNEDAMTILACRYSLWLNRYRQYVPVTIAENISEQSRGVILEHKDELTGMDILVRSERVYNDAKYFSQIIGYVGSASEEDLAYFNKDETIVPYTSDDVVGKLGIERYCESDLRGTDGEQTMYVDNLGKVIDVVKETPAKAGSDVYLSIDSDLQKYCYDMLEKEIASILLAHITPNAYPPDDNKDNEIPITDVYFAMFNNNNLNLKKMNAEDATALEKDIYNRIENRKKNVLSYIKNLILVNPVDNNNLSKEYQEYIEYIFKSLGSEDVYLSSKVDRDSKEFNSYVNGTMPVADFLHYLLENYYIDTSKIITENTFYDSEEIYNALASHIIEKLYNDSEFVNMVIHTMIREGSISGDEVINLIYIQGVLNAENDEDYEEFSRAAFGPYEFMRRKIQKLEITPAMLALDPCSGAVIVTDAHNGSVRAFVSYPSYDNNYLTNSIDGDY